MVHKCGYLPLAIAVIGGILSKKETLQEWEMVSKDIDSYLRFGEGIEDNHQLMHILNLSYEDLPFQLKPCFLYLAYYPEDADIHVSNLYWIWIAEGMVLSKDQRGDETLMEVAERYLTDLVSRSLVQVQLAKSSITIRYESCHLHDLMRDLCLRKCKEEDFLNVMDFQGGRQISNLNSFGSNAYRLVIYGEADDNVYNKILQEPNEGTRAYPLNNFKYPPIAAHGISKILRNLQFLIVVVAFQGLEFSGPKLLHKVIKYLIHLRFLSFEDCKLDEVPSSIAKLPYLQTFHLVIPFRDIKIPNVFWKLKTLMHLVLDVYGDISERKLRLDCLSGLETLTADVDYIEVKDLSKLTNLRAFDSSIRDNENLSLITNRIVQENWGKIKDIRLDIFRADFMSTDGHRLLLKLFICRAIQSLNILNVQIRELPKFESAGMLASSDLVELRLHGCYIGEDPMPMLEKLPKLKLLFLWYNSFVGEELICRSTGFPNLRFLEHNDLAILKRWRIDEGAMPNLSRVSIVRCLLLEMIPDGMKFLKVLTWLDTKFMPLEFNNRIRVVNRKEGVDFHKVRRVPLISIVYETDSFSLRIESRCVHTIYVSLYRLF